VIDANGCSDSDSMLLTVRTGGGGGGGGGGVSGSCSFDVDMLGEVTKVWVTCCDNRVIKLYVTPDPDDIHFLELKLGTKVSCGGGCPTCGGQLPKVVVMRPAEKSPPAPDGMAFVGPVYNFTGYTRDTIPYDSAYACDTVWFDKVVVVILDYDPDALPGGTSSLAVFYYDGEKGEWVELSTVAGRVAEIGKAIGMVTRFSQVAILATIAPPEPVPAPPAPPAPLPPAHFVASNLNIATSMREIWEPVTFMTITGEGVTITTSVANDGGQEGTYIVQLKVNGETLDTKRVTLVGGQGQQVSFTISGMGYGQYQVEVAGLSGEFTVSRTINWWLIAGIIVAIGLIIWGVIWRKRRQKLATQNE